MDGVKRICIRQWKVEKVQRQTSNCADSVAVSPCPSSDWAAVSPCPSLAALAVILFTIRMRGEQYLE
jgi:hypothetical protein